MGRLQAKTSFDLEAVEAHFKAGLEARNKLFHGFYERHNYKIQTDLGRDKMIADLEELHQVLFDCWQAAGDLTTELLSEPVAEGHVEKIVKEGIAKES